MNPVAMVLILVAVAVLAVVGWYVLQRRRSEALQARYGTEYDRAVRETGGRRRAESELLQREERVEQLHIQPLSAAQQRDYQQQWRSVQARFVDDPQGAVTDADRLVDEVMSARGYPVGSFDQRAADISVHHARVVENYRAARDIAQRHRRGEASTEDLRKAMVHYRELFQDLLEDREHATPRAERVADLRVERADGGVADRVDEPKGAPRPRSDREVRP